MIYSVINTLMNTSGKQQQKLNADSLSCIIECITLNTDKSKAT